ncbi:hypothetical protein WKW79_03110 [Variovorax robiniae]|uniref:Secreted protein n=1 Tax=Variovorax robiniae TaxID=1836199 RepID=A0ABU8X149_9BURK
MNASALPAKRLPESSFPGGDASVATFRGWQRIALAWVLLALIALAPVARAGSDLPLTAHAQAGQAFDGLRSLHPDQMPRLDDAQGGVVLRLLGDSKRFVDDVRYTPEDLAALSQVCDRTRAAITAYTSFNAVQQGVPDAKVVVQNVVDYQDELAVLQPFVARCIARQVLLAEAMLQKLGAAQASQLRLGGLKRAQNSLLQLYAGVASCFADSRFGASYCALLDTMSELARVHARGLPLVSRAFGLRLLPQPAQVPEGPRREALQRIVDALGDIRCTGLCLLGSNDGQPPGGGKS